LLTSVLLAATPALAQVPDRVEIDAAARAFLDRSGAPGLAIGVVTPGGAQVFCYGLASKETGAPVDERTLFEIGSISKTFTVALASLAAGTGALDWNAPPGRYVPELAGIGLDRLSLVNLATHTTGGMPLQLPADVKTDAEMIAWFRRWTPPTQPGSVRTYANPSIGLLGVVTARALKGRFAALMREQVFDPLGLRHTFLDVPAAEQQNYAQGYNRDGRPTRMTIAPLAIEAYGVRTTAGDLLRYVEIQMGRIAVSPALQRALAATREGSFQAGPMTQALIWEWYPLPVSAESLAIGNGDAMVFKPNPVTRIEPPRPPPAESLVAKTGGTGGFGSYAAFIPGQGIGLVLLANRQHPTELRIALARQVFVALKARGVAAR
jgi:beta-lactamase class C